VDLSEGDFRLALDGVVQFDGDRDEGEAQEALPVCTRGHIQLRNFRGCRLQLRTPMITKKFLIA
jgi:hypothetical protein